MIQFRKLIKLLYLFTVKLNSFRKSRFIWSVFAYEEQHNNLAFVYNFPILVIFSMIVAGLKPGFLSFSCCWFVGVFWGFFIHNTKNCDVVLSYYKCEDENLIYETKL